jgi:hypothetical protein
VFNWFVIISKLAIFSAGINLSEGGGVWEGGSVAPRDGALPMSCYTVP